MSSSRMSCILVNSLGSTFLDPVVRGFLCHNSRRLRLCRVEVGSGEFMQALADAFAAADSDGSMRILRRPKAPTGA